MGMELTFTDRLVEGIRAKRSILCLGLDPQLRHMPLHLRREAVALHGKTFRAIEWVFVEFFRPIIKAVAPFVIAVKPQFAFYEEYGSAVLAAEETLARYARSLGLEIVNDAKREDGGDTAQAYADGHIGTVPFWGEGDELGRAISPIRGDAVTVGPWIGEACFRPFLNAIKENGTGVFVLDKSSFSPNSEIEQFPVTLFGRDIPAWQALARLVARLGKGTEGKYGYRNFGVVMGATYPEEAVAMRVTLPNSWMLGPGYGKQGGGADGAVVPVNSDGLGVVVNSARAITYAYCDRDGAFHAPPEDFVAAAARAVEFARDDLNIALERADKLNF